MIFQAHHRQQSLIRVHLMNGLVLEGGTFRPIFSCGVMDALLDMSMKFDYVIGVSAGITDGISYVSGQKKRNYKVLMNLRHNKNYIGFRNYLTDRSLFGIKFAYETVPDTVYPFDWETYNSSDIKVKIGVTNARTGKAEYLDGNKLDKQFTKLQATCALPLVFPVIKIDGKEYYDGGIADSIPAARALKDGCDKLLIILTRPKGYHKKLTSSVKITAGIVGKKYPKLKKAMLNRHNMYNSELEYIKELEKQGKAYVIRPSRAYQIESFEKDLDKIKKLYYYGYQYTMKHRKEISDFFGF